jgi:hypothetical protein
MTLLCETHPCLFFHGILIQVKGNCEVVKLFLVSLDHVVEEVLNLLPIRAFSVTHTTLFIDWRLGLMMYFGSSLCRPPSFLLFPFLVKISFL